MVHALAEKSDIFLVAGSSLTVELSASLPDTAVDGGGTLAIVNLEGTPLDERASYTFRDDVTTVFPSSSTPSMRVNREQKQI